MINIFFDFDGVILDSNIIKKNGYYDLFKDESPTNITKFIQYHDLNASLSRFHKIKYFYEVIKNTKINENDILKLTDKYSELTLERLTKKNIIIEEVFHFIQKEYKNYNMMIVSGTEQVDLEYLCQYYNLYSYFSIISGSPPEKKINLSEIIKKNKIDIKSSFYVGDSRNDLEAAKYCEISFVGYNNLDLEKESEHYLYNINEIYKIL